MGGEVLLRRFERVSVRMEKNSSRASIAPGGSRGQADFLACWVTRTRRIKVTLCAVETGEKRRRYSCESSPSKMRWRRKQIPHPAESAGIRDDRH